MNQDTIELTLLPEKQRIQAHKDQTVLEALVNAGVMLRADCGGKGRCGKCRVQVHEKTGRSVLPPTAVEEKAIGEKDLENGERFACQLKLSDSMTVTIPSRSLLKPEVAQKGPILLPQMEAEAVLSPGESEDFGIAVDLGTTTIAVYLCDMTQRKVVSSISMRNPQVIYGDDVISRITEVYRHDGYLAKLQKMAVSAIEWGTLSLCRSSELTPQRLKKMVVVGNSTMIHIFAGEDPASIGLSPYKPRFKDARSFSASEIGLNVNEDMEIKTLPLISGFLGADIIAAVFASDHRHWEDGTMLIDVGTNGEVALLHQGGFAATSCATGPAFEGASIRHGMHAISGAIDAVRVDPINGRATCSVIQKDPSKPKKPSGICGSGVISAVAGLCKAGVITKDGRFDQARFPDAFFAVDDGKYEYLLVSADHARSNRAVTFTQSDVRAIQLAKAALYTGIHLLCRETGIPRPSKLLIAGAFGSYIDKQDALTIGLFPQMHPDDLKIIGNAAGVGAVLALFDEGFFETATGLSQTTRVVDLAKHPDFQKEFMKSMAFP